MELLFLVLNNLKLQYCKGVYTRWELRRSLEIKILADRTYLSFLSMAAAYKAKALLVGITWGTATRLCVAGYDAAIPHIRGGNYGKLSNFLIKG